MESKKEKIPKLDITNLKATPKRHNKLIFDSKDSEYVLICVAYPTSDCTIRTHAEEEMY